MLMTFEGRDILSLRDFSKEEIFCILDQAKAMKEKPPGRILEGFLMASCFFEPSTRTRLSFEAAMKRLGGDVIGFAEAMSTSAKKKESLFDAIKVIGSYADLIVVRHPLEGAARRAAEATDKPLINAGDGANEHPTQTLLDLFSIQECQGRLEGLNIILAGDLKYSRTIHSLVLALKHFECRLFFVSAEGLSLPDVFCDELRQAGLPFSFHSSLEEVIERGDILYMTRIQEERFPDSREYQKVQNSFVITTTLLENGKENLKVFHPLPRVNEIATAVDNTPHAYYFNQAENGLYVRQALLAMILGKLC